MLYVSFLALLALVLGCEPISWLVAAPSVAPAELSRSEGAQNTRVLLDLRSPREYAAGHIMGSEHVKLSDIGAVVRAIPRERDVVLICEHGRLAALAVPYVRGADHTRVSVLEGGIANWRARGLTLVQASGIEAAHLGPSYLVISTWEQVCIYASGVIIKPVYMLLSLALILWLRQSRAADLTMMRWGLLAFLAGETACLLGYYLSSVDGVFQSLEWLHGLGMAIGIGLGMWSLFLLIEGRMLGMLEPRGVCSLTRFCGKCQKQTSQGCQPKRLMRASVLLALPLVGIPWSKLLLVEDRAALAFGSVVDYRWPIVNQLIELRVYPLVALLLLLVAWAMWGRTAAEPRRGEWALFLGLGFLSFSLLRVFLTGAFDANPHWGATWEEVTELIGVAGAAVMLWNLRRQLGLEARLRAPATTTK
jgi:rhodanese-related sulfurtransferase